MKNFLSEYGFAILAAIVVILLIMICTPVGSLIKKEIGNIVSDMGDKTEKTMTLGFAEISDKVSLEQINDRGEFKINLSKEYIGQNVKVNYRIRNNSGIWSEWFDVICNQNEINSGEIFFTANIKANEEIQVRVFTETDIIKYVGNSTEMPEIKDVIYIEAERKAKKEAAKKSKKKK